MIRKLGWVCLIIGLWAGLASASQLHELQWWIGSLEHVTKRTTRLKVHQISAGYFHTCALHEKGVKCWGDKDYGQTVVPQNLTGVRQVSAGGYHTCALDAEGVKCWGANEYGQTTVPAGLKGLLVR